MTVNKYFSIVNGVKTLKQVDASELNNDASLVKAPLNVLPALDGSALTGLTASQISGLPAAYLPKGAKDCSGSPNYPAATAGDVYYISVAGKIGGASGRVVAVNDLIVCDVTNGGGDQATVGADFSIASNEDAIVTSAAASSVDGDVVVFDSTSGKIIKESSIASASIALAPGGVLDAYDGSALTNLPSQAVTISALADGAITAGDIVAMEYVGGTLKAKKANATDATLQAAGFALASASNATIDIHLGGLNTSLSGLTANLDYYLDVTAGKISATIPSTVGNVVQYVGKAVSPTKLNFLPGDSIVIA